MIEHLRRQFLRPVDAGGLPFGVIEAGRGLHQRVETATLRPRPGMAIGRQRHIDDAGTDPRRILRREAERRDRTRADSLARKYRPAPAARAARPRPCSLLSSTKLVSLPRPVSMVSHGIAGRSGPEISSTSAPCAASVRPATGTGDHPRQVQHAQSGERAVAGGPRLWRGLADFLDRDQRQFGQRLGVRQCQTIPRASASSRPRRRRHRPRSRTPRRPIASARPEPRRAPACSSAPCRRRRGDAGNWYAAARSADRGSCRSRRSRPRPVPAACRRRADNARCGIRRRHGACRPRRPAIARCAISRFARRPVRPRQCWPAPRRPTRNDDGSCGSSPVSVTASSAAGSPPADVQRSARISRGVCMGDSTEMQRSAARFTQVVAGIHVIRSCTHGKHRRWMRWDKPGHDESLRVLHAQ